MTRHAHSTRTSAGRSAAQTAVDNARTRPRGTDSADGTGRHRAHTGTLSGHLARTLVELHRSGAAA